MYCFMIKSSFLSSSFLMFAANLFNSVANYILQIFFARFFSMEDYGTYNAVNSLTFFFVFITTPLQNFTIKNVIAVKEDNRKLSQLFSFYNKRFFFYVSLLSIPFAIMMFFTGIMTQIPGLYVLEIITMCIIANLYTSYSALLSGLQLFKKLAVVIFIFTIIRFFSFIIFLLSKASLSHIMLLAVLLAIVNCVLCYFAIPKAIRILKENKDFTEFNFLYKDFVFYLLKTGFIYFIFRALMQSDTLLVKYFFSDYETGIYSSASIFGKAIIYLSGAIVMVLFPLVSENTTKDISSFALLLKALGINLLLSGGGALFLFLFPSLITFLFGSAFTEAQFIIKYIGFAFLPLSMINILFTFYLAKDRFDCIIPLVITLVGGLILLYFFHETLQQVVGIFFIEGLLGLLGFVGIEMWKRTSS